MNATPDVSYLSPRLFSKISDDNSPWIDLEVLIAFKNKKVFILHTNPLFKSLNTTNP